MDPEEEDPITHSPVPTKKPKIDCMAKTDRISELPDEILMTVLDRFRQRNRLDMRTLSRKWKQLSDSCSSYNLNWDAMFCTQPDGDSWGDDKDVCPCLQYKDRFVQGVNQIVQFHRNPQVVSYFRLYYCLGKDSASDIDRWVSFALRKGVRDLFINLSCWRCSLSKFMYKGVKTYFLDSRLFSEGRGSQLETLWLRSCTLGEGLFDKFRSLLRLRLVRVAPIGEADIQAIISYCLNLRVLTLIRCRLPRKVCISGSNLQLRLLHFRDCQKLREIELCATDLRELVCVGHAVKFSFLSVVSPLCICIGGAEGRSEVRLLRTFFRNLPHVELRLSLEASTNWVHCLPESASFRNIKKLYFYSPDDVNLDISKVTLILKAFPLLEYLRLATKQGRGGQTDMAPVKGVVHKSLKEVNLCGFSRIWEQLEFVKFLLGCAVELQKLVIESRLFVDTWGFGEDINNETWSHDEQQRIHLQLQQDYSNIEIIIISP